ncbi:MAG TPA: ABC transporter ATP-binding protein [Victivallales bacterium]|nr:ABC transporter ATP-binding protein [Victivallales bacterium]HPO91488.1 ABC transporter ATP-binding protein [Victivallales bacterium]HRR06050.1 ABC transporter ATP-binding protein [Victivallales bacterium]HRU00835.1 ABC transporter ATP-binding protein [Victivallales bacterium]
MEKQKETVVKSIGLTKIFRDFWGRPKAKAVNDLDFEVYEGEVFGLLGPNGSGKSTTIKMLLGLLYPTSGKISVYGYPPDDIRTKNRIGYLPEESYLYKYLTAEETLDFFGALFNLSIAERKNRTSQLLEMVGLSHAAKRQVGEYSKGMQRRIGLAQAMVNDPDLLILDEPTSGLDPLGCREIKDLILFLKKRGKTVIISSHLLADVEDVCDRVIILYGGKIRANGTLNELLTISEQCSLKLPSLNPNETERLLKILRENLKGEEFSIEHPKRSLEDFFLEVVQKAKNERVETFGAQGGGGIADYLKREEKDKEKEKILEQLVVNEEKEEEEKKEEKSDKILSELLASNKKEEEITKKKETEEAKIALQDIEKIDEKLSKLLNSDKKTE